MLVSETTRDQMMLAYSILDKIRDLYVASSFFYPVCGCEGLEDSSGTDSSGTVRFYFGYLDVFIEIECRI